MFLTGSKLNLVTDFGWLQVHRDSIQKRTSLPASSSLTSVAGKTTKTDSSNGAVATGELIDLLGEGGGHGSGRTSPVKDAFGRFHGGSDVIL